MIGKEYSDFLVKWKNSPISEATWKTQYSLQREGVDYTKFNP